MTQQFLEFLPSPAEVRAGLAVLLGEVVSVQISANATDDWVLFRIRCDSDGSHVRCFGESLPLPAVGCRIRVQGYWDVHQVFGGQFLVQSLSVRRPRDVTGMIAYIVANVRGCGEVKAQRITEYFGSDTLEILSREPERVREVPSISEQMVERWKEWGEIVRADAVQHRLIQRLMQLGVAKATAHRAVFFFKSPDVAEILTLKRPFRLLDVPGFGWQKADEIARRLGVDERAPQRIDAALTYSLQLAAASGHSALPPEELERRVLGLLIRCSRADVLDGIQRCVARGELREGGGLVYLPGNLELEYGVAECIRGLTRRRYPLNAVQRFEIEGMAVSADLSAGQIRAVFTCLESGTAVLTGLPGSGKTTTVRVLAKAFQSIGKKVLLVAPTGKAASRASEVCGVAASTIHRAIGSVPGFPRKEPLPFDVVIVDESGMVGLSVAHWLLHSIDITRTQVVWVGDDNQLPSVEHGFVLGDLIRSCVAPISRLTETFRQEGNSPVIQFARAVLEGDTTHVAGEGLVHITTPPGKELKALLTAVDRLSEQFGTENVVVLSPYRKNALGVVELNRILQGRMNPNGRPGPYIGGGYRAKIGDRVIQTRNLYDAAHPVYNGEVGIVRGVNGWDQIVEVDWGDRMTMIAGINLIRLELAWATTVHRSQGSEYPAVIALFSGAGSWFLSKELLYTAVTRAKKHLTVIESGHSIRAAISQSSVRYTGLEQILREVAMTRDA